MKFGTSKTPYFVAVEELLVLMRKIDEPIRDSLAALERMKRLRFKSPRKEAEVASDIQTAIATLRPFIEQHTNCMGMADQFRRLESFASAISKEN